MGTEELVEDELQVRGVLRLLVRGCRWHVEGLLHTRPEHADTRGGADRLVVSAEAPFGGYRGAAKIDLPVSPCFLHYDRESWS